MDVASGVSELSIPATVPSTVTPYAILASGRVEVRDRGRVNGGHIGASAPLGTDAVTLGSDSRVVIDGATVGRRVVLRDRAQAGGLFATQVSAQFAKYVSRAAFSAPPVSPPVGTVTPGTASIVANSGQTLTRAAGNYGAVTINGTLRLSGGLYQFQSLTLGPDGALLADADSEVRVATRTTAADRARILGPTSGGASGLRLVIAGANDANGGLTLGNDGRLTALVLSTASVRLGDRVSVSGAIAASNVSLGNDSTLNYAAGFECNSDAACADTNPCTNDVCSAGRCAHPAAANGTSCTDSNACTSGDACQAGLCASGAPLSCDDGLFCNGTESCNPSSGCVAGSAPSVDDDVSCTVDACDDASDDISHTPNNGACGTGEVCDASSGCIEDPSGLGGSGPGLGGAGPIIE